ncbi:hypothetical protein COX47_01375 [Candidatus Roizmanbacteria bacterium CG23_combo_of_CG06-09_8_20_14_all_35_49]|uniref:Glycosyl transferase family 28 C-terminal domain-containing protein n=1 Tax=Candidatus Roizmanbacteria bacterium CG23_combo_of_CG06-09_8_20_14_all_35_49 TaxID=1974863 RepID=A0A2G9Y7A3_9BACT|nr:MAG: hypothetical protein COX47_01375 [Candidatus Roizmanbacteria bacterium CG23_combo_of_CG06-09_8_20_14_all_35_49]
MKKILFYTANGVGLGHLRRSCLIAEKIRSENVKIILVTSAFSPQIFGKFFDSLIRLIPLSDKLLDSPSKTRKARVKNGQKFTEVIREFKPDIIIADFYLTSPFTFYTFKHALDQFPTQCVFIWRLNDNQKFKNNFNNKNHRLDYFQKIILPHNPDELKSLLSPLIFKKIKNNKKFSVTGPIFKKIDKNKIDFCRRKYKICAKDFLITVGLGGGGELKAGECESSGKIIKSFLDIYPRLSKEIPKLRAIIITGPYFSDFKKKSLSRLKFIKFEENFIELVKISNLAVSTAGYNTCNELIVAKTPAVLVPLKRGDKEQFERAHYLEKKGIVKIFENKSSNELLKLILNVKDNLNKMKLNFKKFSDWKQGDKKTAKIILKAING